MYHKDFSIKNLPESISCCSHSSVHVSLVPLLNLGNDLLGGRVDGLERFPGCGSLKLIVDEYLKTEKWQLKCALFCLNLKIRNDKTNLTYPRELDVRFFDWSRPCRGWHRSQLCENLWMLPDASCRTNTIQRSKHFSNQFFRKEKVMSCWFC